MVLLSNIMNDPHSHKTLIAKAKLATRSLICAPHSAICQDLWTLKDYSSQVWFVLAARNKSQAPRVYYLFISTVSLEHTDSECKAQQRSPKRNWGSLSGGAPAEFTPLKLFTCITQNRERQALSADRHMVTTWSFAAMQPLSEVLRHTAVATATCNTGNVGMGGRQVFQRNKIYRARP